MTFRGVHHTDANINIVTSVRHHMAWPCARGSSNWHMIKNSLSFIKTRFASNIIGHTNGMARDGLKFNPDAHPQSSSAVGSRAACIRHSHRAHQHEK